MSTQDAIVEDISLHLAAMLPTPLERWAECTRIAQRHMDGIGAWEALAANGHVPQEWVSDPARWFTIPRQFYRRKRALEWVDASLVQTLNLGAGFRARAAPAPIDRAWAAMLAAMGPTLLEAEALAREFVQRSAALSVLTPSLQSGSVRSIVWGSRARRRPATSLGFELDLRSVDYYWRAYELNLRDVARFADPLREALAARLGPASSWNAAAIEAALALRGFDPVAISTVRRAYTAHRMLRALREAAPDTPTRVTDERRSWTFTLPPRSQIADPFEPWLALLSRGVQLVFEHPDAVVLSTQPPPSQPRARV